MKLKFTESKVSQIVDGIQAGVVRNDLIGSTLVIQGADQRVTIKISDLISAIEEQKKQETESVDLENK